MRCPGCEQENPESSAFCTFCGTALRAESAGEEGQGQPAPLKANAQGVSLAELQREVHALRSEVEAMRLVMTRFGFMPAPPSPPPPRPQGEARMPRAPAPAGTSYMYPAQPAPTSHASAPASPPMPPLRPAPPRPGQPPAPPPRERVGADWELLLGGNWLARIGVVAVVIGIAFFLKLAFDNNWIGETGRVVLGILAGLGMLGASEYWYRRYPAYAQALAGGGVAVLYLSIFAAFALYGLLSFYPATGFLLLVSVASAALALRHNSVALAIIGILGAFGAPFILGELGPTSPEVVRAGRSFQLPVYIIGVDIGVLLLATFRNWRWFTLLALLGSLATFGFWYGEHGNAVGLLTTQGSLTIIFLIFIGATTLFHIIWRRVPQALDYALMVANAAAYFGISYGLLWHEFRPWMGGFTLLLALFYGALAYLALLRGREQAYLSLMALGIGLVFLTIAIPVQLDGPWVSVAWAAEGAVLIWLSFPLRMWQLRVFSLGVFAIFAFWLLFVDTPAALSAALTPFLNRYFPAYLISISATYLAAYLLRRHAQDLQAWEPELFPVFLVAANLFLTVAVPVQVDGAWIAVAWAVEAVVLLWLSFRLGLYELRLSSLGVFATLLVRLLVFDTPIDPRSFRLILNYRMLAFASGIVALYLAAYLVERGRNVISDWEKSTLLAALLVSANFLTLWLGSAEVIAAVDSGIVQATGRTADYVKSLSLSLFWAVYASLALVLGIVKEWRWVRVGGLALLAVPILKLFLFDSFALERGYRVAAFLSLGGILLVGGFLYQRYSTAIKGFLFEPRKTSP